MLAKYIKTKKNIYLYLKSFLVSLVVLFPLVDPNTGEGWCKEIECIKLLYSFFFVLFCWMKKDPRWVIESLPNFFFFYSAVRGTTFSKPWYHKPKWCQNGAKMACQNLHIPSHLSPSCSATYLWSGEDSPFASLPGGTLIELSHNEMESCACVHKVKR